MLTIKPKKMQIRNENGQFEDFPAIGGGNGTATQVQADWLQNDITAPDYVKNRTHYSVVTMADEILVTDYLPVVDYNAIIDSITNIKKNSYYHIGVWFITDDSNYPSSWDISYVYTEPYIDMDMELGVVIKREKYSLLMLYDEYVELSGCKWVLTCADGDVKQVKVKINEVVEIVHKLDKKYLDLSNLSLGVHTDGLIYVMVDNQPVGTGLSLSQGEIESDVVGVVDENNTITISGELPKGTYSLKYLNYDGSMTEIGELTVGEEKAPNTTLTWSVGTKLDSSTGAESASSQYSASNYIEIIDGFEYTLKRTTAGYDSKVCYYDENKNFISCSDESFVSITNGDLEKTIPLIAGAKYFRFRAYASGFASDSPAYSSLMSTTIIATK